MIATGFPASAALTFLLSAPAINPVVLVATAVAFPETPEMVLARFVGSLRARRRDGGAVGAAGAAGWLRPPARPHRHGGSRATTFRLVLPSTTSCRRAGSSCSGPVRGHVERGRRPGRTAALAASPWLSVLVLAGLAVVLAICSEADAFVAASLTGFSLTAKLAFLIVGPAVDVKLIALQAGTFGRSFAARFAPATFVVAVVVAAVVGELLL